MLMPLPAALRRLVTDYESLLAEETRAQAAVPSPRLRDLAYTLCVSTGTREIGRALEVARSHLARVTAASGTPSATGCSTPQQWDGGPGGGPAGRRHTVPGEPRGTGERAVR